MVTKTEESAKAARRPVGKNAAPYRQITVNAIEIAEKVIRLAILSPPSATSD